MERTATWPVAGASLQGFFPMLKLAIVFLVISLIAGALGLTNVSAVAKRISFILFALFLVIFIVLVVIALMVGQAIF
jgi:uncharacterized membrane protein YtjA (UPF0391 family)